VNTIDVAAASARGIYVANCPGKNAVAVAELAIGLLVALDRRIPDAVAELRAGRWNKKEYSKAAGLHGRTLGVLGLGAIGCETIRRAAAFGMPVVAWSRRFAGEARPMSALEADELGIPEVHARSPVELLPDPLAVARRAEALTVHLALSPETRGLVNDRLFAALRPGALFLNTARAELVDPAALARAVRERGLRAGLDVFAEEPAAATGEFRDPVVALPGVYGTHHVGASTEQAQEAIAAETVRIVAAFAESGRVPNAVNLARRSRATHRLLVRHRDVPGVLAHVFDKLRAAGINVQETENVLFAGVGAAVARIGLTVEPGRETLAEIAAGHPEILEVRVTPA
jgi:D-3-phosphoglycerate dehydrogenase